MPEQQDFMKEIATRLEAIGELASEARIRQIAAKVAEENQAEFARKMRFPGDNRLAGTKFARWGLDLGQVAFLRDMQLGLRAVNRGPGPSADLDNIYKNVIQPLEPADDAPAPDQSWQGARPWYDRHGRNWQTGGKRAMDSAESGFGLQLVGVQYVPSLWDVARPKSAIASLFDIVQMTAPTAYVPVAAAPPELLLQAESTASDSSNYATSKTGSNRVALAAKLFVLHQMWSGIMEEDSIVPWIPFLQEEAAWGIAYYMDSAVLNGDTTDGGAQINTSSDPAATRHYLAWDGLRHAGLVDQSANSKDLSGAAVTFKALMAARGRMLDRTYSFDWGHPADPADLAVITSPEVADAIALLDEVITVDKFGQQATILTGQVARIGGAPLVSSIAMPLALATGFVHASTGNVYGSVVTVNRRGCKVGWRRRITMETERIIGTDQTRMVYTLRAGFGIHNPAGNINTQECVDVIYDIGL